MALSITDTLITSNLTGHQAAVLPLASAWTCTWCPDLKLDRNQAITAMSLAEIADRWNTEENFPLAAVWAAELDMAAGEAVQMIRATRSTPEGK